MKRTRLIVMLMVCLAAAACLSGCGVSHGSPEGVVKSLVTYYEKGNEKKVLDCYGLAKDADKKTEEQIASTIAYFEAMKSKGITLVGCDLIEEYKGYSYVYISYIVEISKNKSYPKMETYMVKEDGGKHYVIPTKDITEAMSQEAKTAYATFMTTEPYKEYVKSYETFLIKNPNFEEELTQKLK